MRFCIGLRFLSAGLFGFVLAAALAQPPTDAAGARRGGRGPAGPLPPAPMPDNLDVASTAAVNQKSTNNRRVFAHNDNSQFAWVADVPDSKDKYVALFNASPTPPPSARRGPRPPAVDAAGGNVALASDTGTGAGGVATTSTAAAAPIPQSTEPATIVVTLEEIGLTGPVVVRDLWTHQNLGTVTGSVSATVNSHGAVLYRVSPVTR